MNSEDEKTWNGVSLKEHILQLIEDKKTQSEEFKLLLKVFGREKIVEWWKEYKLRGK